MKKRIVSILAGTLALMLLLTAVAGALAKGGKVAYNQVNLSVFSEPKVTAGQTYRLANGLEIPSSINYTNEAGGDTTYVPIRMLAELMDANLTWNQETKTADFAALQSVTPSDIIISVGTGDPPADDIPERPSYGQRAGAFEEIDPSTVSMQEDEEQHVPMNYMRNTRVQYSYDSSFPVYTMNVHPIHGDYIIYTVTNNGQKRQYTTVLHQNPLDAAQAEPFSKVLVKPGETLVRVFRVDKDANSMDCYLAFGVGEDYDRTSGSDVTVSLKQCFME